MTCVIFPKILNTNIPHTTGTLNNGFLKLKPVVWLVIQTESIIHIHIPCQPFIKKIFIELQQVAYGICQHDGKIKTFRNAKFKLYYFMKLKSVVEFVMSSHYYREASTNCTVHKVAVQMFLLNVIDQENNRTEDEALGDRITDSEWT